jgi:hypothetical protein
MQRFRASNAREKDGPERVEYHKSNRSCFVDVPHLDFRPGNPAYVCVSTLKTMHTAREDETSRKQ